VEIFNQINIKAIQRTISEVKRACSKECDTVNFIYMSQKKPTICVMKRTGRQRYLFQVVQTQTTAAYCRILPILDSSDTATCYIILSTLDPAL
jgi:hypothetical protein